MKRVTDFVVAVTGLVLLMPVFVLLALLIRLDSPGPVFYRSRRVGMNAVPFDMWKFRTMIANADQRGPLVTAADDRRITRVGRVLRRAKLDELPSLWNVVAGEMSLVGPRPENPQAALLYSPAQREVWRVRPGITSPASLQYRNEEALLAGVQDLDAAYFEILQAKLRLDLEYIQRPSVWNDLRILIATGRAILHL